LRTALRSRRDVSIGYATGELERCRTTYVEMIERVRAIVNAAAGAINDRTRNSHLEVARADR
jgi:hypothetical protein